MGKQATAKRDGGRIAPLLATALAELEQGRAAAAERASRKALRLSPANPDALRLLGLSQMAAGDLRAAVQTVRRAVAGDPDNAKNHYACGLAHRAAGDTALAIAAYRAVLARLPEHGPALNDLAGLLLEHGEAAEAVLIAERAVRAAPRFAAAYNTLGNAAAVSGSPDAAVTHYRRAIALAPSLTQVHHNLGLVLLRLDQAEAAMLSFRQALAAQTPYAPSVPYLVDALREAGRRDEAIEVLRGAVTIWPHHAALWIVLGTELNAALRVTEAEASFRAALRLRPEDEAAALNGLGYALAWRGQIAAAREAYHAAAAARPAWLAPRFHEGVLALALGEFAIGFALWELRSVAADTPEQPRLMPATKVLTPEVLADIQPGQAVLIDEEQGFGDTVLFARFLPDLAKRGLRVVLRLRDPLVGLLRAANGVAHVIGRSEEVPPHDCHAVLPSVGWILGISAAGPGSVPYLKVPEAVAASWAARLAALCSKRDHLVAINWWCKPAPPHRAIPLSRFAALFDCPGVRFVSVQKDTTEADRDLLARHGVIDLSADLADFADTAAVLQAADLTVSVDTAVANLAGALGRPLWVALAGLADWRWGVAGDSSTAWYPSARLFRQATPGDWDPVIAQVRGALLQFCGLPEHPDVEP